MCTSLLLFKKLACPASESVADCNMGLMFNHRLFVVDLQSGVQFLVDSGSDVSILPKKFKASRVASDYSLTAANGTSIQTFGTRLMTVDFGFKRKMDFIFIVANVPKAILGADFLKHFGLIVDIRNRKLLDSASFYAKGGVMQTSVIGVKTISSNVKYEDLLKEFSEITKIKINPYPVKHDTVHHIETFGPPVFCRARRLNPAQLKIAKDEFSYMLKHGICRPSKSPWASPLHMVPKGNSDWRPTGDYRALNARTKPDKYPLPNLYDFTQNLAGKKIFSKIDLVRAFNQIPVHEKDIEKTAVITPFGLFEFVFLPYGLCNAPQTFQRFINSVLFGLDFLFCYLDDILIASSNEAEHLQHLRLVFQRLSEHGITINVSKSVFGVSEISFLGHLVNAAGCKPLPEKVQAILDYPPPKTIKELRRFIGCLNFYRRFVPRAAEIYAPLNDLLRGAKKADAPIDWSEQLLEAFQKCKDSLVNITQLSHPEPDAELVLFTDASDLAVAGALHKRTSTGYLPLSFFSKKFNNAQKKYSAYDRELLAIYLSIIHFQYLLEGRQFCVITDHRPLTFAFSRGFEKCSPRRLRHLEYISQFTTDIRHIPGAQNLVADALSRVEEIVFPNTVNYSELADHQSTDEDLKKFLNNPDQTNLVLKLIDFPNFNVKLYCDISQPVVRLFVPLLSRRRIFDLVHGLAHPGARSTVKQVCSRYVWPSVRKDVTAWCRACLPCQRAKVHRHTVSPLGQIPTPNARFQHIHLDLVGPLPVHNSYRYCLTITDRFTRWIEAIPLVDIKADTVSSAFLLNWVARFGAPARVSCDQGKQLESATFKKLLDCLGCEKQRTTAYNPKSNGFVERCHRTLKAALMCNPSKPWTDTLPLVLLGLRTALHQDWKHASAELVFGQTLRLPGEFFTPVEPDPSQPDLIMRLRSAFQEVRPVQASRHGRRVTYVPKALSDCTHVFLRVDLVRKSLQPPYDGPYLVLSRKPKIFLLQMSNEKKWVSIDRLKPAFMPVDCPDMVPYKTRFGRTVRFRT